VHECRRERVNGSGRVGVAGGARWCTVGILSSRSVLEEPITTGENR
jgi:hypothetical protein